MSAADGNSFRAMSEDTLRVEACVNGRKQFLPMRNVWCLPEIKENLFSVLSIKDENWDSRFVSSAETCVEKTVLVRTRIMKGCKNWFLKSLKLMLTL